MGNTEFSYLLREIILLKVSNETTGFKVFVALIPLISSIITSIVTIFIAFKIFDRTTTREKKFMEENEVKEKLKKEEENKRNVYSENLKEVNAKETLYRRLYGSILSINTQMIEHIKNLNYYRVNNHFQDFLLNNSTSKTDIEHYRENAGSFAEKYMNEEKELGIVRAKYLEFIGEYYFINPDSKVYDLYMDIISINPLYLEDYKFDKKLTSDEQWEHSNKIIIKTTDYIQEKILIKTNELLKVLLNETKEDIKVSKSNLERDLIRS